MASSPSSQDASGHSAQRELEHKALRNVRGLVDRLEADEAARRRTQKWIVAGLAAIVLVLAGAILFITSWSTPREVREIIVAPASKAPAR